MANLKQSQQELSDDQSISYLDDMVANLSWSSTQDLKDILKASLSLVNLIKHELSKAQKDETGIGLNKLIEENKKLLANSPYEPPFETEVFEKNVDWYLYLMSNNLEGNHDDLEDFEDMRLAALKLVEILDKDIQYMKGQ